MRLNHFVLLLLLSQANCVFATPVTGFSVTYKNGQVFCTWVALSSDGVQYRLYKSAVPILHGDQLPLCQYLGCVGDSSSFNKRLSEIEGQAYYLKTDSLGVPLDAATGLFVTTTQQNGSYYYALTTKVSEIEDTMIMPGVNSLINAVTETVDRPKPVYQITKIVTNHAADVYVLFTSLIATPLFPQMVNVGSYPFNFSLYRDGSGTSHPLTIKLQGGGGDFLHGFISGSEPGEYRISLDDWLPNEEGSTWLGYNEQYDIFSSSNAPPVSGVNYDYALERLEYTIDWAIRNLPVDSNSIYFSGVSLGASGSFFASMVHPSRIAAVSMKVPKFDLGFLNDPDTTNNYNAGMPGRLRVDSLLGTVATNLPTNLGPKTYDLTNGAWLAHEHANDNVPLMFAVNGKKDTMVGWAEKIPYYDSVNANRLGGSYLWDNRDHSGDGERWIFSPNLLRYHRNVSFPAFSNCSINNNPGDGHANSGDSVGTINGFLDWNDSITDDTDHYEISVFLHDLPNYYGDVISSDSCFTDITLRRLQNFSAPNGALILWQVIHQGELVQTDSFLYSGGLITLNGVKIFRDTSVIKVSYAIPDGIAQLSPPASLFSVYPNPATHEVILDGFFDHASLQSIVITDVTGREWFHSLSIDLKNYIRTAIDVHAFPSGIYFVKVNEVVRVFVKQ